MDEMKKESENFSEKPLDKLFAAMAEVQGTAKQPGLDCHVDFKTKDGRRIKYDYASMGEVLKCLKEPMKANGISIIQYEKEVSPNKYILISILTHKSGQSMKFVMPMFGVINNDPKNFGTSITYARRYALYGIFNLYGQVDTDGSELDGTNSICEEEKSVKTISNKKEVPTSLSVADVGALHQIKVMLHKLHPQAISSILKNFQIGSIDELSTDKFEEMKNILNNSIKG